jgi:hypothetical protein
MLGFKYGRWQTAPFPVQSVYFGFDFSVEKWETRPFCLAEAKGWSPGVLPSVLGLPRCL